ncbi:MAG: LysE family translocator [Alphaproteobacteria bacterium]|nr:LysE family translocator [Alphaproteobacteria bacterium]
MTLASISLFAVVFGLACAAPGPTIAALVARVLGGGTRGIVPFCLGLVASDLMWLAAAAFGLAVVAAHFQPVFAALKYLGAAYLLYLAWKLWTAPAAAPVAPPPPRGEGARLFLGAIAVGSGNPKTMLFYLALLPTVIPIGQVSVPGFAALAAIVIVVYGAILAGYVFTAERARRALKDSRVIRYVNRATGAVMAGAAAAIASRP